MISILIPTYGRPARLKACIDSIYATAERPDQVEVLVRVDAQDGRRIDYIKVFEGTYCGVRAFYPHGQTSYGKGIEFLRGHAKGDILFAGADDVLFRTPGWDAQVRTVFGDCADGLLVAYANNGLDRQKCEHFFTTRQWAELLGYMVRPEFRHFCVDQWVEELARGVDRLAFLRTVVVEHMHRKYAKAPDDDTYRMVRGDTKTSERDNALYATLDGARRESLARLRAAIGADRLAA